ncbi:N-acetylmuramoyl-L-alanine amidase [Bradyrhizobium sp. Gha]|uniref:N-acetylmuramoyl-L-alanine amidase n=1 Tax=Bradyrhizobium sp. Gha TaxID=1855318 RepID=UPI0008E15281|nr:N-acetylmuramoyl-L-alanine amidase [Bradyrhizobium sp. Gha]SFJ15813.1 N-acetylmuramoyl-L-alanine amidase [Bradyrhizobium sp. Gha]
MKNAWRITAALAVSLIPLLVLPGRHGEAVAARKAARAKPRPSSIKPPAPERCDPRKFKIILDVGHTSDAQGATSARNDVEFGFNLHLARLIGERLTSAGFAATRVLVTEGNARASLLKRVGTANAAHADFFLSIHHDSVPDKMLEPWEFEGAKSYFSDRFSGHSLFVSERNPRFAASLVFARLLGRELKDKGLHYATQYALPLMGRYRHPLLDKDVGVYRYDGLVVLSQTRSAAVLLEAGSIINRDEEMAMNSPERQELIATAVVAAMRTYCERR